MLSYVVRIWAAPTPCHQTRIEAYSMRRRKHYTMTLSAGTARHVWGQTLEMPASRHLKIIIESRTDQSV